MNTTTQPTQNTKNLQEKFQKILKAPCSLLRAIKKIIKLTTTVLVVVFACDAFANNQIDEATEQRIIREQNRVIQNQQIALEAEQRKREADIIARQTSSIVNKGVVGVDESQKLFSNPKKIKEGCSVINSSDLINGVIPTNPPLIAFFHDYLLAKSLHPKYLTQFDCAKKLEEQAIPLFALDHEPLEKPILQGDTASQILHLHREIIRNLYQIVQVYRDKNGEIAYVAGIKNGLLFVAKDDQFFKQVLNPKVYFKFSSELNGETREEYFISIKSYQRIKKYLSKLNQLEVTRSKGDKDIKPGFAVSYSAFVNGLSVDAKKDHQFAWIDEIRQATYFSFYDLTTYLINSDQDSQVRRWGVMLGYFYSYELLRSNFVLIKAINELGLAPKSILPLIEKSLKSGNKDFCQTVKKNSEKPITVDQLTRKQNKMFDVLVKYCPEAIQIKVVDSSKKTSDAINKK